MVGEEKMEKEIHLPWEGWKADSIIGRGTFGEVYRACKIEYGHVSEAAVKIIHIRADEQKKTEAEISGISLLSYIQEIQAGLVKEIDIMDSLKGAAHIVSIEDSKIIQEKEGWTVYIRMELLKNLVQIQKEQSFGLEEVIRLGCDLCEALEACEKREIIHRDIKPANIFWSELGGYKLGDFGISRYLENTMGGATKAGTETYMAPEIYRGESYGKTIDIYSLGLVLYQLANTGRLPFLSSKQQAGDVVSVSMVMEARKRRIAGEILPNPFLGGDRLGNVLRKACAFFPEDRYQSASAMKKALSSCIGEKSTVNLQNEEIWDDRTVVINHKKLQKPMDPLKKGKKKIIGICSCAVVLSAALVYGGYKILPDIISGRVAAVLSLAEQSKESEKPVGKEEKNEESLEQMSYSGRIWENDDRIYTVYKVEADSFFSISGNYVDTMAVYDNKIYWRRNSGTENILCPVIRMNPDKSDQEVLTENAYSSSSLCIADGWLYYIAADDHGNKKSRKINLETGNEEEASPYFFRNGNDKVWFSTSLENGSWYQSEPGFKNLRHVEEDFEIRLGVIGYKFYYMHQMEDGTYTTYSYDAQSGDTEIILRNQYAKSILNGDRLYFKQVKNGNTILYEMNPETGEKESYNLGDFHLYMGGGLYGLKDQICLMRFCPERKENNTEFWSLDKKSGQKKMIGQWYNSNAVNAAQEP